MKNYFNPLSDDIEFNQAQAALVFGVTARTLRDWESLNEDLRGDRPNQTTVRYTLTQLATFSRRMRQPLSLDGVKSLGMPLYLFSDFFTRRPLPVHLEKHVSDKLAGSRLKTLQFTEELRRFAEGETDTLTPAMASALRHGFRSAPAEVTAVASILASLDSRDGGGEER